MKWFFFVWHCRPFDAKPLDLSRPKVSAESFGSMLKKLQRDAPKLKYTPLEQQVVEKEASIHAHLDTRRWLKGTRPNGRVHREASGFKRGDPTWMWKTGCGWKFGLSEHYQWLEESELPGEAALFCDKGCDIFSDLCG